MKSSLKKAQLARIAELLYLPTLSEPFDMNRDLALLSKVRSKEDVILMKNYAEVAHEGEYNNPLYTLTIA